MNNNLKNTLRILLKILSNIFIAMFSVLILILLVPYLFQVKPYYVMSGSMSKTINYGSVVYVKAASFDSIKPQDIATFHSTKDPNKTFTHRIIGIDNEKRSFTTKGDANPTPDLLPIGEKQLVGKVVFTVPYAGTFSVLLKNSAFKLTVLFILIFWIAAELEFWLMKKRLRNDKNG